jgi:hypothetical protein
MQKARRCRQRFQRIKWVIETNLARCSRHELRDPLGPRRAGLVEPEPALLPDQPSKERDRNIAGPLENVAVRRSVGDYELRHYEEGYGWPVFCLASREER